MATNLDNLYFTITETNLITDLNNISRILYQGAVKSGGLYQTKPDTHPTTTNPTIVTSTNSGRTPMSGDFTLYQMENQLTKNINIFLTEYSKCVSSITPSCYSNARGMTVCSSADIALIKAQNMQYILKYVLDPINGFIPSNLQIDKGLYDASYQYITSNYNKLLENRNQLDQQMKDIQKSSDSVYSTYKGSHDSTMYSQILLTVLATSLIYYVFVKL